MDAEYLTKKEAAKYIRVSMATLDRLMSEGIPHFKLSRRVLFRKTELDVWLESKRVVK